jgi:hypothetical protein
MGRRLDYCCFSDEAKSLEAMNDAVGKLQDFMKAHGLTEV